MNEKKILRDTNNFFGYLLKKGFSIDEIRYETAMSDDWFVVFTSLYCKIRLISDRGELSMDIGYLNSFGEEEYQIGLRAMIYHLTQGSRFVDSFKGNTFWGYKKQISELAQLLQEYIDPIVAFFTKDNTENRHQLRVAQLEYKEKYLKYHNLQ